jgi:alkanesulfonate monooxygenase SsuD/methylene tetrahydromethanopterin reductase-like flavin-dependent oxidoreductase (luciferase family)
MLCLSVIAADSEAEARRLFTSLQLQFINLRRGRPDQLQPPVDDINDIASPVERAGVDHALAYSIVGSRETVRSGLERFLEATAADELMVTAQIYDHAARVRSYEIVAEVRDTLQ